MTYDRFEDLPVCREAARFYESVEELLENESFHASLGFRDQLDPAGLSVSNNIAEGFERGTTNELLQFIYIARGSAGEVTLKLRHAAKHGWTESLKSQISSLNSLAESCSRQLRGWADSLQNSDIRGQRHLTETSRRHDEHKKRAALAQTELLCGLPLNHPFRLEAEKRGMI